MSRTDAQRRKVGPFRFRHYQSFAKRRHLLSQEIVRSTTHRLGNATKRFAACTPAGYLDDGGAAALLAPDSCAKYRKGYGVWLSFLMDNGWLDPTVHPADRITRRRLAAYFQAMRDRNRRVYSINGRFQELRGMMKAISSSP